MAFQSTKFLFGSRWVLGSLLFIVDKFGDLSLQEPESREVIRSDIVHHPPAPIWVSLVNKAQLRHGSDKLGTTDTDPSRDKADHNLVGSPVITDPINQSPPKSDSKGGKAVYMVGQGEELLEKTTEEITREAKEEIARAAHLAKEDEKGKRHNSV
jgi:hypothetical protein